MHDLAAIDLNLLVALDLLIAERSVTRAARRAGVTQSAMSHTLRRLRDLFDNPLLVRSGGAMVLTPRAEAAATALRTGLHTLHRVLEAPAFDPATARRTFRLAAPDLFDALALPRLVTTLRAEAPGVDLVTRTTDGARAAGSLATGALDLAVLGRPQLDDPGSLVGRTLFHDGWTCLLRRDHPAADALTLDAFVAADHALISPRGEGDGLVDAHLADRGLQRRVVLRLPRFTVAPRILGGTDLILTAPASLADLLPADGPLVARPCPLPLPDHAIVMLWHPRLTDDPGHRWLRAQVGRAADGLGHPAGAG